MHVVMPLLVLWSALGFELHPAVKVGLIALALSPVPPMLPGRASVVHGQASYTVGLLTTTAVLSIFFVPLALWTL
jgi:BASS family bile acid:Na+ symporter